MRRDYRSHPTWICASLGERRESLMHCQHGSTSKLKLMRSTSKLKLMRSTSRFPFSAVPFSSKETEIQPSSCRNRTSANTPQTTKRTPIKSNPIFQEQISKNHNSHFAIQSPNTIINPMFFASREINWHKVS